MMNDLVIHAWYGNSETHRIMEIAWGDYGWAHVFEVVAPLLGAWLLLQKSVRRSLPLLAASSALLIAGVFVHRFLIMPAAYNAIPMSMAPFGMQDNHWSLPIASGRFFPGMSTFINYYSYMPSLVEVVILLGIMAYAVFLVLLAIDKLPILIKERI